MGYTVKADPETTAHAIGKELPISPKKSVEVCRAIKGMHVEKAKEYLEDVIRKKKVVPYRRYKKTVAHKKGIGPGGYPVRVANEVLKVIEAAQANADYKGLDSENMRIMAVSAHRGRTTEGTRPRARGRSTPWNKETVNIELTLKEEE